MDWFTTHIVVWSRRSISKPGIGNSALCSDNDNDNDNDILFQQSFLQVVIVNYATHIYTRNCIKSMTSHTIAYVEFSYIWNVNRISFHLLLTLLEMKNKELVIALTITLSESKIRLLKLYVCFRKSTLKQSILKSIHFIEILHCLSSLKNILSILL